MNYMKYFNIIIIKLKCNYLFKNIKIGNKEEKLYL